MQTLFVHSGYKAQYKKLAIYSQPHKHVGGDKVVLGSFSDGDIAIQICSLKFCDCVIAVSVLQF